MKAESVTSTVTTSAILALVQLLAFASDTVIAVGVSIPIGAIASACLRFFEGRATTRRAAIVAGLASMMAVALAWTARLTDDPLSWLAPPLAAGAATAAITMRLKYAERCALCSTSIHGTLAFNCPRCGLHVCERSCWIFERLRCALCERNQVPLLTSDARWWDRQLGPRVAHGRCQLCLSEATAVDLRACRRCGRSQCRECWDSANGECSRCAWSIEDLPTSLRAFQTRHNHA